MSRIAKPSAFLGLLSDVGRTGIASFAMKAATNANDLQIEG